MKLRAYPVLVVLIAVAVVATVAGVAILEVDKSKLRRQIAHLGQNATSLARLRAENARTKELLDQFKTSGEDGAKAIHADLVAARAELAALETKAGQSPAVALETLSINPNRDPTKAMTRPEFLTDAGRATPEAAFQTLVWAAMKGREPEMAACVSLDPAAQAKAESLLGTLSAEARAKYGTPEQLVGLVFSHGVLEASAFQIVTSSVAGDGDHATLAVRVRANGRESETKIPMVRSGGGWSMAVAEKQIDVIRRGLTAELPTR
jgi:hypothetical protein